jgi:hypothetical protein
MLPITSYVLVGVTIVCAKKKGLSTRLWIVLGALFGPLALPFVFLAKPRNTETSEHRNLV